MKGRLSPNPVIHRLTGAGWRSGGRNRCRISLRVKNLWVPCRIVLQTLTSHLLAFSRRQILEPKVLDPNGVIVNLEKMLRPGQAA